MTYRLKKVISLVLLVCFVFCNTPFVLAKDNAPKPTLSPLQDLLRSKLQAEEDKQGTILEEEITPEEQEILDEINNNTITITSTENQGSSDVSAGTIGSMTATEEEIALIPEITDEELETMSTSTTSTTVTDEEFKVEPIGVTRGRG